MEIGSFPLVPKWNESGTRAERTEQEAGRVAFFRIFFSPFQVERRDFPSLPPKGGERGKKTSRRRARQRNGIEGLMALPFAWMYRDPAEVAERMEEEIAPKLKIGEQRDLRNRRRRIRALLKAAKARNLKGQR